MESSNAEPGASETKYGHVRGLGGVAGVTAGFEEFLLQELDQSY